jgi:hypothetical protein
MINRPVGAGAPPPFERRDLEGPSEGSLPLAERQVLVEILRTHTTTAERCWFCVWEGFGGLDRRGAGERLHLPQRDYLVFGGPLETVLLRPPTLKHVDSRSVGLGGLRTGLQVEDDLSLDQSPSLWWPDDRGWFVATEIDHAWTYIGGTRELIETLMSDARLEVLPVQLSDIHSYENDLVNAALD